VDAFCGYGIVPEMPITAQPQPGEDAVTAVAERVRSQRVVVVMPAYNAAQTLERTYADIPHELIDQIILVDDVSKDETVEVARTLGLSVIVHHQNLGYGGNQKTCYDAALADNADVVVMLHPDYQYDATRIPALIAPIVAGTADLMLGSRFLGDPLAGGMPRWKYVSNRFLTILENLAFGLRLSEYHTGLRAYSRRLLETIPYRLNSNDFVFDQELIAQVVAAGMRARIGEIAVPTRYFEEASSVGFRRSVVYGLSTLRVVARYVLHRARLRTTPKLRARRPSGAASAVDPTTAEAGAPGGDIGGGAVGGG
jgi:glycosyltransferase involved in cell wall biosynthesis